MLPYLVDNASKLIPLLFAVIAALGFAAQIVAGFFGIQLPEDTAKNIWSIVQISIGGGLGSGATQLAQSRAVQAKVKPLGKLLILVFLLSFALSIFPQVVFAESPQPYLYAMTRCSGLSITQLQGAQQDFDTQYGWQHQLTTQAQWSNSYEARANEFAHALGCPQPLRDGALMFAYKIYVPTYQRILTLFPE